MKLTSNHKKILLVSLFFLAIGMFTGNMGLKSPYRETSIETNQEIELLSIRQDLINNKLYYEKDIENRPEDIENYNSRGFYPSFRYNNTYDSYEIWDNMYVSNTDEVEKIIEKAGIKNFDVLKIDKNYETRLPIDNPKILGKENVRQGFFGQEINITTYNLCRINMFLHDIDYPPASLPLPH